MKMYRSIVACIFMLSLTPAFAEGGHGADGSGGDHAAGHEGFSAGASDREHINSISAGPDSGILGAAGSVYNNDPVHPGTATRVEINSGLGTTLHTTSNPHGDAVNVTSGSTIRSDSGRVN
jgi:hypothetical protein